jgi:serine O-acetyltransferase
MFSTLIADLRQKAVWYGMPVNSRSLLRMTVSDGSTAQILYRAMRFCQTHRLKPLAFFLYRLNAAVGHVVIGRGADIGSGLVIVHSFGIVINSSVRAGRNLVLEHGVTIGAEKNHSPVLADNVFVGAGAKIIGPVRVGSDVKIGANAVVTRDVPDGATVVGVPGRVIKIYGERVGESAPHSEEYAPLSAGNSWED